MEDITKEEACGFLDAVQDLIAVKAVEKLNELAVGRDASTLPAVALLVGCEVAVDMIRLMVERDPDVLPGEVTWDELASSPEKAADAIMASAAETFTQVVERVLGAETRA